MCTVSFVGGAFLNVLAQFDKTSGVESDPLVNDLRLDANPILQQGWQRVQLLPLSSQEATAPANYRPLQPTLTLLERLEKELGEKQE
jgi:hypothetical protein